MLRAYASLVAELKATKQDLESQLKATKQEAAQHKAENQARWVAHAEVKVEAAAKAASHALQVADLYDNLKASYDLEKELLQRNGELQVVVVGQSIRLTYMCDS